MLSLLERFDIDIPKTFQNVNLIGLDFGDGEVSAACVTQDGDQLVIRDLLFDAAGILRKTPNAHFISPTVSELVMDYRPNQADSAEGCRYYNFKKCPGTPEIHSKYIKDDGTQAPLSYEEVMAIAFNVLVNRLFKNNRLLDPEKRTIILVGCPSSPGWQSSVRQYASLLECGLHVEGASEIRVAVQEESWAALARETDPKWGKDRVQRNQVAVILDNGSSTFDMTVIGRNGLAGGGVGEDSFQFGGNCVDDNLLELMQERIGKAKPGCTPQSINGHKLGLRIAKERYYGLEGDSFNTQLYTIQLNGELNDRGQLPRYEFRVDDETMDYVLKEMPVTVYHFEQSIGAAIMKRRLPCNSFLDACEKVYQSFYEKIKPLLVTEGHDSVHPLIPDRVILSGGVSVMPEVRDVIRKVFGVQPEITDLPNYSVSEGLAYVLKCEIRKAQYLDKVMDTLGVMMQDSEELRKSIINAGVDEDWTSFKESIRKWSEDPRDMSIQTWYSDYWLGKEFNDDLGSPMRVGAKAYFEDKIKGKLSEELKKQFRELFADYADDFTYELPDLDFSGLGQLIVDIPCNVIVFFGGMLSEKPQFSRIKTDMRTQEWKREAYSQFLKLETTVRKGGSIDVRYSYIKDRRFLGPTLRWNTETVEFIGLDKAYRKGFSSEAASHVRDEIKKKLVELMKDYVEMITPYFHMTAKG